MQILITGGTGFIGDRLIPRLTAAGNRIRLVGRKARLGLPTGVEFKMWDAMSGPPPMEVLSGIDAVVHLAGEPVSQRWTPEIKRRIRESRVQGTRNLLEGLSRMEKKPEALVCASAIGYYGDRGEETLDETSPAGGGFLPQVCVAWEEEARKAEPLGIRTVTLRIGIVLGKEGGALRQMLLPFQAGVGGRLGSGQAWMSWIHVEDMVELIGFSLENQTLRGALNATAPNPVRNAEFTQVLAAVLRRPALFPVPEFVLKLLFGEMAGIILASQRVVPAAALAQGYAFRYPALSAALRDLLA